MKHTATLTGHTKTVNCVRFSPSGAALVSSGDGGEMLLWAPAAPDAPRGNLVAAEEASSAWRRAAALRGHTDDVMDIAWAPDGSALASGSIDNKVIVWEVSEKKRGAMITQFAGHKHFVQGVAWDPAAQYVVSQSADRTARVYALRPPPAAGRKNKVSQYLQPSCDTAKELYCAHTLSKRAVAPHAEAPPEAKVERLPLFLDESAPTFFRRPSWSPDGAFLALPAGTHRAPAGVAPRDLNTAYLYTRGSFTAPVAHLPAQNKPVVAVRFCPVLFARDADAAPAPAPFDALPYKMVFAVATLDSVVLYDTTSALPLAVLGQLHYDSITEMAWSRDGRYLAVASRDCYCSLVAFEEGELGQPLPEGELPPAVAKWAAAREAAATAAAAGDAARAQLASPAKPAAPAAVAAPKEVKEAQVKRRIQPEAVPAAKKAKRIVPETVQPAPAPEKAEAADKGPKRITPTPLAADPPQQPAFDGAKSAAVAPPMSAEPPADQGARRRITPVPVGAPPAAPAAAPAVKPGGLAAIAMAAGLKAAAEAQKK